MMVTEPVADVLRELHPLRIQHRFLSDDNPFMAPLKGLAASVREARQPASPDNLFVAQEKKLSEGIIAALDHHRDMRDRMQERMFKAIYGPRALGGFLYSDEDVDSTKFSPIVRTKREAAELDATIQRIKSRIEQGGFVEGWARIVAALMQGSGGINERELEAGRQVREQDPRLNVLSLAERKRLLKEQAHMLQLDEDGALRALPKLLSTPEERRQAWAIAKQIALGDGVVDDRQRVTLDRLSKALSLETTATAAE
jgi:tellurite resistance protein